VNTEVVAATDDEGHAPAAVAIAAERRWAWIVGAIIVLLIAMMVFTGVHWAAMPPSRVETVDPRTLHLAGEFVEDNLGTSIGADGKVVVRLIAQQYSFQPQCIVVPAQMPVTFRATSTDALHGFVDRERRQKGFRMQERGCCCHDACFQHAYFQSGVHGLRRPRRIAVRQ